MKLTQIQKEWETDSPIDITEIALAAADIPRLHSKYQILLTNENIWISKLQETLKTRSREIRKEIESGGFDSDTIKGDYLEMKNRITMKQDIEALVSQNAEIMKLQSQIVMSREKINFLESVIKILMQRTYQIKNIIEAMKEY